MRYDLPQVYLFIFAILQPVAAEVMPNQAKRRHGRNSCQPDHIKCLLSTAQDVLPPAVFITHM